MLEILENNRIFYFKVRLFSESFGGTPLWDNASYISPAKYRQQIRKQSSFKYLNRVEQKAHAEATKPKESYKLKPLDDIFEGSPLERAKKLKDAQKKDEDTPIISEETIAENKPKKKNKVKKKHINKPNKVLSSKTVKKNKKK